MAKYQKRETRIKQTKHYILEHTSASLLNNKKWHDILNKIEETQQSFKVKLLLSDFILTCDFIRELEKTSALFDDSGNFIEYLEIEYLTINRTEDMAEFLNKLKVMFSDNSGHITIMGYAK